MSSPKDWTIRIRHVLEAIVKIHRYTASHTEATLADDEKTVDAVIRNFQVIGDAARRVPAEVRAAHPEIPWSPMEKMRHVVVHDYDRVDLTIVWHTIQNDLPPLVEPLKRLLGDAESSGNR
jgi:uncharacterized protein with HEPN domain